MFKTILIISALVVAGFAATAKYEELHVLWNAWKSLHSKFYTAGEDAARFGIFMENYKKVVDHNAKGSKVKLALNQFADLTGEEFKAVYSGCAHVEEDKELIAANTVEFPPPNVIGIDWRQSGIVTGVKNQGQCGSCWTFSTTGVLEGFYALQHGVLYSFSEQQIVDCASGAGQGCNGGYPYLAIAYAAGNGLEQESTYPYTAQDGYCQYNPSYAARTNSGYQFVAAGNSDALKGALNSMPVSVLIEADQQVFQLYSSGVLDASSGCGANLDHAVLAVGYDSSQGEEAFIVKNSWGGGWGQGGYVYISTDGSANNGAGVCGILSQPVVPY